MIVTNDIVNIATTLAIGVVGTMVWGPHPIWEDVTLGHNPPSAFTRRVFLTLAILMSLINLTNTPQALVKYQWEDTNFANEFFPFTYGETNADKRVLAGTLEGFAILLTLLSEAHLRALGYGTLMIMYGRATLINGPLHGTWLGALATTGLASYTAFVLWRHELSLIPKPKLEVKAAEALKQPDVKTYLNSISLPTI